MYDLPFIPDEKDVKSSGKFYYEGRYFDKEEEFWKHVLEYSSSQVNRDTLNRMIDRLKDDLWVNYCISSKVKTNGEMKEIVGAMLLEFIKRLRE